MRCATAAMRENLGEQLTLEDLAKKAMFSKFHFSRVFLRTTGVSPGRFLSALRLQEAKTLLLTTEWNVVDIAMRVGYMSVGTFSTRFSQSVGLSPSEYRRRRGYSPCLPTNLHCQADDQHRVHGRIVMPGVEASDLIFVGLFPGRIAQGRPISSAVVTGSGRFSLCSAYEGDCYLLAFSASARTEHPLVDGHHTAWMANRHLGSLRRGERTNGADLWMSPKDELDAPILLALPEAGILAPMRVEPVAV
jgi:AraC family transcriptional regulator